MKKIGWLFLFLTMQVHAASLQPFKVAAVEFNPRFMQFDANLPLLAKAARQAAIQGAKLIVLPEAANSGYLYNSRQQINPYLDTIPGKTTKILEPIAHQYHTYIAVGVTEVDPVSHLAYNAAALIGPEGYIGKYRKNQLNSTDTRWATRGNLGYPVFNTELGKLALVICYDDVYLQSLLIPSLRGANIIAYITASDRLLLNEAGAKNNHSTIANIASLPGWLGLYVVATTRTDSETNPETGVITHYDGGASIWDPMGHNLAQAPVSTPAHPTAPITLFAQVDPTFYQNPAKTTLMERRRPELYQELSLYRAPTDPNASSTSHQVNALSLQYEAVSNDKKANLEKIKTLLAQAANKHKFNLIVLPENSLIGDAVNKEQIINAAESLKGFSITQISLLAKKYHALCVLSMPEKSNQHFYETAVLINSNGKVIGIYRKSHLNKQDQMWATPGEDLPVFATPLGRIGFMLGDEVRVPDIASVMAVKRADIIIIPSAWHGEYAGRVEVDPGLLIKPFPKNTMFMWYDIAKYAQAYTIVANYVKGKNQDLGGSGLYSLAPIQGLYPPKLASTDHEEAFFVSFKTLGSSNWWINQNDLIIGRRAELTPPELLPIDSNCFKKWQTDSVSNHFCWTAP